MTCDKIGFKRILLSLLESPLGNFSIESFVKLIFTSLWQCPWNFKCSLTHLLIKVHCTVHSKRYVLPWERNVSEFLSFRRFCSSQMYLYLLMTFSFLLLFHRSSFGINPVRVREYLVQNMDYTVMLLNSKGSKRSLNILWIHDSLFYSNPTIKQWYD